MELISSNFNISSKEYFGPGNYSPLRVACADLVETFINLPGHGDVHITVECLQPTIQVYLEPVSNLEVAARDIRPRNRGHFLSVRVKE